MKTKIDTQTELIKNFEKHIKETHIAQIKCDIKKIEVGLSAKLDVLDKHIKNIHFDIPTIIGTEVGRVISNTLQQLPTIYPHPTLTY